MVEIEMRPRNVIAGKNIMMVSLPVLWSENQKLQKGDVLRCVVSDDGKLVLWKDVELSVVSHEKVVKKSVKKQ